MSIVSAPFTPNTFSPSARTEEELAYELLNEPDWSDEAYLLFSEALNRPIELSDRRLIVLPMPSLTHQRILKQFVYLAQTWLTQTQRGEILFAAHPIRLWPGKYREPDAMIWLNEHKDRMGERESGPPDLALEIISPNNEQHDLETKFREYAQAGIAEYWIVQPESRAVLVHTLESQSYKLISQFNPGQRAASRILPGFEVAVDDLFATG